jgi:hypothetical protein
MDACQIIAGGTWLNPIVQALVDMAHYVAALELAYGLLSLIRAL